MESRKLFKLNYGLCGSDDASDIVFTPSETTEAPEESREASRRQLLEGNLDTFPTLQSRVVRIFVTSSFSGIILKLVEPTHILLCYRSAVNHSIDDALFESIITNSLHTLQPYLPDRHELSYNLRERSRNRSLIIKTVDLTDRDVLTRMLYKFSY